MPITVKPCEGSFSEEVQSALANARDRTQWAIHTCHVCGASVGAIHDRGKWVPEQHWPSVKYPARKAKGNHEHSRFHVDPDHIPALGESIAQ
jgi:hypothetical protein